MKPLKILTTVRKSNSFFPPAGTQLAFWFSLPEKISYTSMMVFVFPAFSTFDRFLLTSVSLFLTSGFEQNIDASKYSIRTYSLKNLIIEYVSINVPILKSIISGRFFHEKGSKLKPSLSLELTLVVLVLLSLVGFSDVSSA